MFSNPRRIGVAALALSIALAAGACIGDDDDDAKDDGDERTTTTIAPGDGTLTTQACDAFVEFGAAAMGDPSALGPARTELVNTLPGSLKESGDVVSDALGSDDPEAAEAESAPAAVESASAHRPDVVLMDLHLGDSSGIEATREIVRRHPDIGVLVVTMMDDDDSVVAAMRAGARGYLLKGAAPAEVERAIRAVANGEVLLGRAIATRAVSYLAGARKGATAPFPDLTDREREVLDLVAHGLDNSSIARRLTLSPKTVRNHLSNVLTKLQVTDRSQAIVRAREAGLGGAAG